ATAGDRQHALLLERADDRDHLGLRLLDGAGTHRAEQLHLLEQVLARPPGRSERLRTTLSRTSCRTPLSAVARSLASTSRSTSCSDRSSIVTMSSKTNICDRTCSAGSGAVLSSHSRMERSVGRGERLMISTRVSTPPTVVMSWCARSA